jgi:dihydrofolate synthase / folylpolyglutamate synthase
MTYQEILTYIYGLGRFGIKPGLSRIKTLLKSLSNPQDCLQIIHVAGTNGKGSTAAFLSAILTAGGHNVGFFSSPHLIRFTERLRINGAEITEAQAVSVAGRVIAAAPEGTTFFELVTAMAYLYFAEQGVDTAIMEVGMGGRLDATNAAAGILSIITPIAFDHCEYLGDSIAELAGEKAGIIKPGRPVVVSTQVPEALEVIRACSSRLHSPLYCLNSDFSAVWQDTGLDYHGLNWQLSDLKPGIGGCYQSANAACALFAAELLAGQGWTGLGPQTSRVGIETASWPGRMELLAGPPRILLDGAHNPSGAAALAESLSGMTYGRLILVTGIMENKDIRGILAALLPLADQVIAVTPGIERAFPSAVLVSLCRSEGISARDGGSIASGLAIAVNMAQETDLIVVCGSLYAVGEARAILFSKKFEPFRG